MANRVSFALIGGSSATTVRYATQPNKICIMPPTLAVPFNTLRSNCVDLAISGARHQQRTEITQRFYMIK